MQSLSFGQKIEGRITDIAFGGEGILKTEGAVIFVPQAALNDKLTVEIVEAKKSFYRARILQIDEPSSDRISAPCPYYGRCGGCQYQHVSYEAERRYKEMQLNQILRRIGKIENPPIRSMLFSEPYGYRNRISVHEEQGKIGFHATQSYHLIDIKHCLLALDEVNQKLTLLRKKRRSTQAHVKKHYSIRASSSPSEAGFGQINAFLLSPLRQAVSASFDSTIEAVLECYAGSGFLTQAMPEQIQKIIAIEMDEKAASEIEKLKLKDKRILQVFAGPVENHLTEASQILQTQNRTQTHACLLDPPREGLSKTVREELLQLPFQQIIYLSCNPATLARDLNELSSRWRLDSITPIDLFPRTAHLECLAVLKTNLNLLKASSIPLPAQAEPGLDRK